MRLKHLRVFAAMIGVLASLCSVQHASAATYVGCQPSGRSNDGSSSNPYYRWDGWSYPSTYPSTMFPTSGTVGQGTSGPVIGGVYSTLTTYANYSTTSNQDYDWQWVMLTNDIVGTGSYYGQIGPMTGYQADNYGYTWNNGNYVYNGGAPGADSTIFEQYLGGDGIQITKNINIHLAPGTAYIFTVLYNYWGNGEISYWYNSGSGPIETAFEEDSPGWTPTQAQVEGETHTNTDQMYGDIYDYLPFSGSNVWYTPGGGSANWYAIDTNNQATITPYTMHNGTWTTSNSEYGYRVASNSEIDISDLDCPQSVSSGAQIPVNYIFDAAGTGAQKTLQSGGPTLANGPYVLTAQAGGNLVLSDGNNEALWSPQQVSASNYLVMQNDDNLVLYNGAGGAALWNSHTGGSGYSNPYAIVQNDGNFVVYGTAGHYLWQSATGWDSTNSGLFYGHSMVEGQSIYSPSNGYHLYLGTDCNFLLLNSSNQVVWATWTGGDGSACHADMQTDGNFVLYRYAGPNGALWNSGTGGTGAWNHMVVGSSGTFSVYDLTGAVHYTS